MFLETQETWILAFMYRDESERAAARERKRVQDRERHAARRAQMTDAEHDERRRANRERMRALRARRRESAS